NPTFRFAKDPAAVAGEGSELGAVGADEPVTECIEGVGELGEHDRGVPVTAGLVQIVLNLVEFRVVDGSYSVDVTLNVAEVLVCERGGFDVVDCLAEVGVNSGIFIG